MRMLGESPPCGVGRAHRGDRRLAEGEQTRLAIPTCVDGGPGAGVRQGTGAIDIIVVSVTVLSR